MKEDIKKSTNIIKGPWTLTETMKKRAANASTDWAKKEKMAADDATAGAGFGKGQGVGG